MKIFKTLAIFAIALTISAVSLRAEVKLNASNGIAAGKALLALYQQYKADGKLDISKTANITNLISLATNVQGLTGSSTTKTTPASFVTGLINGSSKLVNKSNSNSVLGALGSIANLDLSSLSSAASALGSSSTAASAAGSLLSKITGGSGSTGSNTSSNTAAALSAASTLTNLFKTLK